MGQAITGVGYDRYQKALRHDIGFRGGGRCLGAGCNWCLWRLAMGGGVIMQTQTKIRTGEWIDSRTLVADIHGGYLDVVHLTEITDTPEMAEKQAQTLRQLRRHRESQTLLKQCLQAAVARLC